MVRKIPKEFSFWKITYSNFFSEGTLSTFNRKSNVCFKIILKQELKDVGEYLKNLTRQASEKEASLSNLNPLYKEVYVIPAQKHADGLLESARSYDE